MVTDGQLASETWKRIYTKCLQSSRSEKPVGWWAFKWGVFVSSCKNKVLWILIPSSGVRILMRNGSPGLQKGLWIQNLFGEQVLQHEGFTSALRNNDMNKYTVVTVPHQIYFSPGEGKEANFILLRLWIFNLNKSCENSNIYCIWNNYFSTSTGITPVMFLKQYRLSGLTDRKRQRSNLELQ